MLLKQTILMSLSEIGENRSVPATFHLLTGRKSIQTIQDAKLFRLEKLYGVYPSLKKEWFNSAIAELEQNGWILIKREERMKAVLTSAGRANLESGLAAPINYLNGMRYHEQGQQFLKRIWLLIQTLSHLANQNHSFIPVVDDRNAMLWVKQQYQTIKGQEIRYLAAIYKELEQVLLHFPNEEAQVFVERLTGYRHVGKSFIQIAQATGMDLPDVHLLFTAICHKMLAIIEEDAAQSPILCSCRNAIEKKATISESAHATLRLLNSGMSAEQVARARSLKTNTILDHIVEITLHDEHFSIRPYVSEEEERCIMAALQKAESAKLKDIKQVLTQDVSYFKIRLVLARTNLSDLTRAESHG